MISATQSAATFSAAPEPGARRLAAPTQPAPPRRQGGFGFLAELCRLGCRLVRLAVPKQLPHGLFAIEEHGIVGTAPGPCFIGIEGRGFFPGRVESGDGIGMDGPHQGGDAALPRLFDALDRGVQHGPQLLRGFPEIPFLLGLENGLDLVRGESFFSKARREPLPLSPSSL